MYSAERSKMIVLSDIDGTIIKGSLVLDHACSLHDNGTIDLGQYPELWRSNQKDEELVGKLSGLYRVALKGLRQRDLGITAYLDKLFSMPERFYSTLGRIKELQAAGAEVHLVSGSPNFLVGPFARRMGMKYAGSHYSRRAGVYTGDVNLMASSDAKRGYVASLQINSYSVVHAFGDTASDAALFEVAHHSTLVDPTAYTESLLAGRFKSIIKE